jgi:riboflavin synthase alpha subunit
VAEDGQYTVTFDCAADLSAGAVSAGVTGLNNLTAIYIKDQAVTDGEQKKSNLASCDIRYDSITVDGVELTLNQSESKSALKSSGIFDTNDPFNSWDGSAVDEVEVKSHVLNLAVDGVENPQSVTVTFTLSNLVFEE